MTIKTFPPTAAGEAAANAVAGPKNLVFTGTGFEARTGADYVAPLTSNRSIPASDFRDRFTAAELAGVSMLAYSGTGDVNTQLLVLKVSTNRDGIDLDAAETIGGLDYLVTKAILTNARKAVILA